MTVSAPSSLFVLGTRPEIIKFAPVIREFERRDHEYVVCHTGQHYSDSLDSVFFDQLELPEPEYNLDVGSGTHAKQTAAIMRRLDPVLATEQPDFCLVQGDTNSALAGGLVAAKRDVSLCHVEAGLRSFDREMPEELNRVLVDHASDLLFAPTRSTRNLLLEEGIPKDQTFITGNTIVDAVFDHATLAGEKSSILEEFGLDADEYVVLTAHRAESVDDPETFAEILSGVATFVETTGLDCYYPIHPRARNTLEGSDIRVPDGIHVVDPLDFLDFLELERNAALVFTDSGGVQEETCILGVPCVTVRTSTERPESVDVGANRLAGLDRDSIAQSGLEMLDVDRDWPCPFGDGTTAEQIADILEEDKETAESEPVEVEEGKP